MTEIPHASLSVVITFTKIDWTAKIPHASLSVGNSFSKIDF